MVRLRVFISSVLGPSPTRTRASATRPGRATAVVRTSTAVHVPDLSTQRHCELFPTHPFNHSALAFFFRCAARISRRLTWMRSEPAERSALSSTSIAAHSIGAENITEMNTPRRSK